jgi:hypothetical protein
MAKSWGDFAVDCWGHADESSSGFFHGSKHREHRSTEESLTRSSGGDSSSEGWLRDGPWDAGSIVGRTCCSCGGGDGEAAVSAATTGADGRGGVCRDLADGIFAEVCGAANLTL